MYCEVHVAHALNSELEASSLDVSECEIRDGAVDTNSPLVIAMHTTDVSCDKGADVMTERFERLMEFVSGTFEKIS